MAQVLTVYREVPVSNEQESAPGADRPWVVISYDEKPGIQALANVAPQLPPVPGQHATLSRDHEYRRCGTLSLLAGIDLHDGRITGLVRDHHRSREFIEFLERLHQTYPPATKLRLILDNHSAHVSKETVRWLKSYPNRFEFVFTPKHGPWLNIVETFFSKMTRTLLRHLRADSKQELKQRIEDYLRMANDSPVVFRWTYRLDAPVATPNSPTRGRVKLPHLKTAGGGRKLRHRSAFCLSGGGFFEPPALALEAEQVSVVHDPIEERGDDHGVAEEAAPVVEGSVRGDHG
jgi:transposase